MRFAVRVSAPCVFEQVKIMQNTGSPTLWGDACCVLLSGTMPNVMNAQRMILERIANISDRLKEMVRLFAFPDLCLLMPMIVSKPDRSGQYHPSFE